MAGNPITNVLEAAEEAKRHENQVAAEMGLSPRDRFLAEALAADLMRCVGSHERVVRRVADNAGDVAVAALKMCEGHVGIGERLKQDQEQFFAAVSESLGGAVGGKFGQRMREQAGG